MLLLLWWTKENLLKFLTENNKSLTLIRSSEIECTVLVAVLIYRM